MPWLPETYPDLVDRYEELYRGPYAPASERDAHGRSVANLIRSLGGVRPAPSPRTVRPLGPRWREGDTGEQLTLV